MYERYGMGTHANGVVCSGMGEKQYVEMAW